VRNRKMKEDKDISGRFMNLKEVFAECKKQEDEWNANYRVGDVQLDKNSKTIDLLWENHCYDIELNRIKTPNEAFHWICHLHEKNWVTPQMLSDFVEVIKRSTTVNEYCNPDTWGTYGKSKE
jgi:hypothetical protein